MAHTQTAQEVHIGIDGMDKAALMRAFAARLLRARQRKNWSQADLVRASGLTKDSISKYHRAESLPHDYSLAKLADALGVKPGDLMPSRLDDLEDLSAQQGSSSPIEFRVMPGNSARALLRIDQIVSTATALKIIEMLNADAAREQGNDNESAHRG